MNNLEIDGLLFKNITNFAPEQWHIYKNSVLIGYVRLRHGILRAFYARENENDELFGIDIIDNFFVHEFKDNHNNLNDLPCFENNEQRNYWLNKIAKDFERFKNECI